MLASARPPWSRLFLIVHEQTWICRSLTDSASSGMRWVPYQPLLEALTRWGKERKGATLVAALEQHAPSWLTQMPSLLSPERARQLARRTAGSTRDRMLRELTNALEAAASAKPLILVLEDLHWSDVSTVDWLAAFARRRDPSAAL